MALSRLSYVQANMFEIRPIDTDYKSYGIAVKDDDMFEQFLGVGI